MTNRRRRRWVAGLAFVATAAGLAAVGAWRASVKAEANRERAERCRAWFATLPNPPRDFIQAVFDPVMFDPDHVFPWPEPGHFEAATIPLGHHNITHDNHRAVEWPGGFIVSYDNRQIVSYALRGSFHPESPLRRGSRWTKERALEAFHRVERLADPHRPASIAIDGPEVWARAERTATEKMGRYLKGRLRGHSPAFINDVWQISGAYTLHGVPLFGEQLAMQFSEDLGLLTYSSLRVTEIAETAPTTTANFTPTEAELETLVAKALDEGALHHDAAKALRRWLDAKSMKIAGRSTRRHDILGLYYVNDRWYFPLSGDDSIVAGRARLVWVIQFASYPMPVGFFSCNAYFSPDGGALVGAFRTTLPPPEKIRFGATTVSPEAP